jgi:uncharacterized protein (TIGR00288 family)
MEAIEDIEKVCNNRNEKKIIDALTGRFSDMPRVGLYIDFPNVYATARQSNAYPNMRYIKEIGKCLGNLVVSNCYTIAHPKENQFEQILSLERMGYKVIPRFVPETEYGMKKDIDSLLITDFMRDLCNSNLNIMIIASNDSDFVPIVREAKERGVFCIVMVSDHSEARVISESANIYLDINFKIVDNKEQKVIE